VGVLKPFRWSSVGAGEKGGKEQSREKGRKQQSGEKGGKEFPETQRGANIAKGREIFILLDGSNHSRYPRDRIIAAEDLAKAGASCSISGCILCADMPQRREVTRRQMVDNQTTSNRAHEIGAKEGSTRRRLAPNMLGGDLGDLVASGARGSGCLTRARTLHSRLARSQFCLEPSGDTLLRSHFYLAVLHGCVPVLFDGMHTNFNPETQHEGTSISRVAWWAWRKPTVEQLTDVAGFTAEQLAQIESGSIPSPGLSQTPLGMSGLDLGLDFSKFAFVFGRSALTDGGWLRTLRLAAKDGTLERKQKELDRVARLFWYAPSAKACEANGGLGPNVFADPNAVGLSRAFAEAAEEVPALLQGREEGGNGEEPTEGQGGGAARCDAFAQLIDFLQAYLKVVRAPRWLPSPNPQDEPRPRFLKTTNGSQVTSRHIFIYDEDYTTPKRNPPPQARRPPELERAIAMEDAAAIASAQP